MRGHNHVGLLPDHFGWAGGSFDHYVEGTERFAAEELDHFGRRIQ